MHISLKNIIYSIIFALNMALLPMPIIAFDSSALNTSKIKPVYQRIFYYSDNSNAKESLYAHADTIDILAPQSYAVNNDGVLEGKVDQDVLNFAHKNQIKVMPLIVNKSFGQKSLETILNSESKQKRLFKDLIRESKRNNYIGWQVDFEQINVEYKERFNSFIKSMSERLHEENLIVSVAVVAKISDNPKDYKNTLWTDLIGVYDYSVLSQHADFISIMSYDAPDSKGPIAPYPWLKKVLNYSLEHIPASKLSLGLGLYYWKWDDKRGKLTGIGGYEGLKTALSQYSPKLGYSNKDKAPYLKYVRNGVSNTVWYEDDTSIKEKVTLIKNLNLHGFSAWALGLELPAIHLSIMS